MRNVVVIILSIRKHFLQYNLTAKNSRKYFVTAHLIVFIDFVLYLFIFYIKIFAFKRIGFVFCGHYLQNAEDEDDEDNSRKFIENCMNFLESRGG